MFVLIYKAWVVPSPQPNLYVQTLNPIVAVFGYRAFREVIKGKWGHKSGNLIR